MRKIYIVGAGGFGREILWLLDRINSYKPTWDFVGFIDDNISGSVTSEHPILGGCEYFRTLAGEAWVVVAIGSPRVKKAIVERLQAYPNIRFATLIDPSAMLSSSVTIDEGSIVCAGSILTVDIEIGKHVAVNLDCTVGHDAVLQDYVTVYPGVHISGNVNVGQCVELGTGSQIIQGKKIEHKIVVGAGSVITKDLSEQGTYAGAPVRRVK